MNCPICEQLEAAAMGAAGAKQMRAAWAALTLHKVEAHPHVVATVAQPEDDSRFNAQRPTVSKPGGKL